ncbi:MAG TPA: hypothetical protein VFF65_09440 [Phycisphaerales bacterium]|nr:hypothetical protein [Phycisphaerales bacterium]
MFAPLRSAAEVESCTAVVVAVQAMLNAGSEVGAGGFGRKELALRIGKSLTRVNQWFGSDSKGVPGGSLALMLIDTAVLPDELALLLYRTLAERRGFVVTRPAAGGGMPGAVDGDPLPKQLIDVTAALGRVCQGFSESLTERSAAGSELSPVEAGHLADMMNRAIEEATEMRDALRARSKGKSKKGGG